jgi:hypothetical protein
MVYLGNETLNISFEIGLSPFIHIVRNVIL